MNTVTSDTKECGWWGWLCRPRGRRITTTERAVIAAHGKALAVLTTALQGGGHLDAGRFAEMLALFGVVVSEDDGLQGAILAKWAETIEESVAAVSGPTDRR
ncbi:hypothetical protein [Rhizorhapis sp. SPR117]|uniref:hypothetical protein n=1 Tax=Rhizorhapis sp. SPR117 TaxID=2912611 RepID=UPI001F36063D|nr:hypothetical protein [Rhizorhapis sp. SPR117]